MSKQIKWERMHISKKIIIRLTELQNLIESSDIQGTTDIRYREQIKLRLEASKILAESWNKEYIEMGGK